MSVWICLVQVDQYEFSSCLLQIAGNGSGVDVDLLDFPLLFPSLCDCCSLVDDQNNYWVIIIIIRSLIRFVKRL